MHISGLKTALAVCAAALAFAGAAAAQPTPEWRAPESTVVNPPKNTSLNAWEPYKARKGKPSTNAMLDDPVLKGAIDIHAHFGPDSYDRQWDIFEIAKIAQARGMRGAVFKNHWAESAGEAWLVRKYAAPGFEAWGGLALNTTVGGINPMAVRYFAEVEGHYAKVVWFPTHDSEQEVLYNKETRPYVRVSKDGVLLPEVLEVLDLIKQYDLTLATGHVSPKEMLQIVSEAKKRGIDKIILTHPGLGPQFTDPSTEELKQAVDMGGYFEVVASELLRSSRAAIVEKLRAVGPAHTIVSTDSGLVGTPYHPDALVLAARVLREEGFKEADLDLMFKANPAKVLGLPVR